MRGQMQDSRSIALLRIALRRCNHWPDSGTLSPPSQSESQRHTNMIRQITRQSALAALLLTGCCAGAAAQYTQPVDPRSYNLGIMGGFAEVVRLGVKTLALSEVMSPDEMDDILPDAQIVAERNGVLLYRETDFLVTDLFPADVAAGKHVLLIYIGDTLDDYLQIKADKQALIDAGDYDGAAREDIARRFGRLLSYPEVVIDDLLSQ